jgi:hypothetical protein
MVVAISLDTLTALLPLLVLAAFWLFISRRVKSGTNPMLDKLEELRQELERIRRAVEHDPFHD